MYVQHTDRTFHSANGSVTREDSRLFFYPFDYLGMAPIAEVSPLAREAVLTECEGLYCEEPVYIPVRHLLKCVVILTCALCNLIFILSMNFFFTVDFVPLILSCFYAVLGTCRQPVVQAGLILGSSWSLCRRRLNTPRISPSKPLVSIVINRSFLLIIRPSEEVHAYLLVLLIIHLILTSLNSILSSIIHPHVKWVEFSIGRYILSL